MELKDSPLWQEIKSIAFEQKGLPPIFSWKAEFLANKKKIKPFKVVSMEIFRDFRGAYGDEIILEVMIPAGDFVYDIYPYREDLLVNLTKQGAERSTDAATAAPDIEAQELRCTLMDDYSVTVEGMRNVAHSKEALNTLDILTIKIQLLDKALERIRLHDCGGLFRDTKVSDVLNYILTSISNELDLDETNVIKGVEMVDSPNQDTYKHIVIPHGTKFPDVPVFLHKKVGGLYPTGMGLYLFKQHWYVYPLYDLTRFDQTTKTLTLINVPTNQLPHVERTFRTTANQVIALVTGDVKHTDRTESAMLNQGNGVRYLDARRVVDGFADTTNGENKASVMRAENNNEFVTEKRDSGLNNVMTSKAGITSNKFAEMSKLAGRSGAQLQCLWQNSDMSLIYPGMPVKYMYIKDDRIHELKGVVLGAQHYIQTHGKGITESRHICETALHLFVEREKEVKAT
jgi:hypothetical protein